MSLETTLAHVRHDWLEEGGEVMCLGCGESQTANDGRAVETFEAEHGRCADDIGGES